MSQMVKITRHFPDLEIFPPRMRVGNVFSRVCLSVCISVQAITFEPLHIETSFLV